jgi:N-acetylneuraminic acid mutarotase
VAAVLVAVAAGAGYVVSGRSGDASRPVATGSPPATTTPSTTGGHPAAHNDPRQVVRVRRIASLAQPVQDAAVAALDGNVYAFGGLDSLGSSTTTVSVVRHGGVAQAGTLPVAIHDAAAATSGNGLLVLGGGQTQSFPAITRFDPSTGQTRTIAQLPTPLSDLAVAAIGDTAYVVGGYTGSVWSDRIESVAGGRVRVVGHLPLALRYAAVAAIGGDLIIAGGATERGASEAVYRFSPDSGAIARIGSLPHPLMHASAGTLDGVVYVVGGLGADGAPVSSVIAVTPSGETRVAARLPHPLSDAGVAGDANRLVVVGGNDGNGPVAAVLQIDLAAAPGDPAPTPSGTVPARFRGPLPGDLLIADRGNNRMLIVDPSHRILWRYPSLAGQRKLSFDDDAFFVPGTRSIISNEEDNHDIVQIAYPSGRLIWSYGHSGVAGSGPGYLNTPDDAYKLRNGLVIVSDDKNCRLLEIRGKHVVRSIGQPGRCVHDPPRALGSPNGDTPLPNGNILVSEIYGSWVDEITLGGKLVRSLHAPVAYPSDPQLTLNGNILISDYSSPGGVVIIDRQTGKLLWRYQPVNAAGQLDHPSLAAMLPNGKIIVVDDYNDRIVIINPGTQRIVWQYGHKGVGGTAHGYLHIPDGFDFVPVTPDGRPDLGAIVHGP